MKPSDGGASRSHGRVGRRTGLVGLLLAVGLAALGVPRVAGAQTDTQTGARRGVDRPRLLSGPKRVRDALPELRGNGKLEEARLASGVTAQQLDDAANDDTIWMDDRGGLFAIDPPRPQNAGNGGADEPPDQAPRPYANTFLLHSRPGSNRVIYLDFDGETITNTQWNAAPYNLPAGTVAVGIDFDGSPSTYNPAERDMIQSTWQRVAEDYAPFDVDVTTQDPGLAAIDRTDAADTQYGTRMLYTNSPTVWSATCGQSCGGIANIGGFDDIGADHQFHQPGFAFQGCNTPCTIDTNFTKFFGEVGSHEVGHYMGLFHHGTAALNYYSGHGQWAPIMGDSYSRPVSQWSHGEYTGANRSGQDDLAVISAGGTPLLADDHGDTTGAATVLPAGPTASAFGIITTRTDVDVFRVAVPATSGRINITALPAPTSPNLDIKLDLLDAGGTQIATADPAVGTAAPTSPFDVNPNLKAPLSFAVTPGANYFLRIDGIGNGAAANTGYSDYASVGRYTLSVNFVNTGPSGVTATSDAGGPNVVTVNWLPPGDTTGITYYLVVLAPTAGAGNIYQWVAGAASTTTTIFGPAAKEYTATVYAYTTVLIGGSPPSAPVTVLGAPAAPTGVSATGGNAQVAVSWTAPVPDPGVVVSYYRVLLQRVDSGAVFASFATGTATSAVITGLARGQYRASVEAATSGGLGLGSDFTAPATVLGVPGQVGPVTTTAISGGITANWTAPADDGGTAVTFYRITAATATTSYAGYAAAAATTGSVTGIPAGTYTVTVAAGNAIGLGAIRSPAAPVAVAVAGSGATALLPTTSASTLIPNPAGNPGGMYVFWNAVTGADYYYVLLRQSAAPASPLAVAPYYRWVAATGPVGQTLLINAPQGTYVTSIAAYSNTTGFGAFSPENQVTPGARQGLPGSMTTPTGTGGASVATVAWTAPNDGGSAISYYRITLTPVGGGSATVVWALGASTSQVVYAAPAGSYTARVQAYNDVGFGPQSPSSAAFTIT